MDLLKYQNHETHKGGYSGLTKQWQPNTVCDPWFDQGQRDNFSK